MVCTGDKSHYGFGTAARNNLMRNGSTFGVLRLKLGVDGYKWKFLGESGATFADSGTGACRA